MILLILSGKIFAQQSFFNVPSSDITDVGKIFIQQQTNIMAGQIQLNQVVIIGLGHNLEVGINLNNIGINTRQGNSFWVNNFDITNPPVNPGYLVNVQKGFNLNEHIEVAFGTQQGISTDFWTNNNYLNYTFANSIYKFQKRKMLFVAGFYYANDAYFGRGDRFFFNSKSPIGIQFGIEKHYFKDKLMIMADFTTGLHNLGEIIIGGGYNFVKSFQISMGWQIPNPNSLAASGLLLEFSFNPVSEKRTKYFSSLF